MFPWITVLLMLPLAGATFAFLLNHNTNTHNARNLSLWVSLCVLLYSMVLAANVDFGKAGLQLAESHVWMRSIHITYYVALDGLSLPLVLLTTSLVPLTIIGSWHKPIPCPNRFYGFLLLLEFFVLGVFLSVDVALFYIFFEAALIPMFFIIGAWGGTDRLLATFKFFFYSLASSLVLLMAVVYLKVGLNIHDFMALKAASRTLPATPALFWAVLLAFSVKLPVVPLHAWLPKAHVEAPTEGSMLLAGVLLKLGAYGLFRFLAPVTWFADSPYILTILSGVAIVSLLYASLLALQQDDMKKMVAYASIAHMSFIPLAIFNPTVMTLTGAAIIMVAHGLVSAGMFLSVGLIKEATGTRQLSALSGLATTYKSFAILFFLLILGMVAFPLTLPFWGEVVTIWGMAKEHAWLALAMSSSLVIGAAYPLHLFRKAFWGKAVKNAAPLKSLPHNVVAAIIILVALMLVLGLMPQLLVAPFEKTIIHLTQGGL